MLDELSGLTATIHERVKCSKALAQIHDAFHAESNRRIERGLRSLGISERDSKMATVALVSMLEGIHLHSGKRDSKTRDELVLWVIQRVCGNLASK